MINLDGSYGEGGGQIIRTALSLSILTHTDVNLINIRANRTKPGLAAQHLTAVKAAAKISNAEHSNPKIGTREFKFRPNKLKPGKYEFDIGTAGSITLALQTLVLPTLIYQRPVHSASFEFRFTGGTDVNWSPPYDYFNTVFLGHLQRLGFKIESSLLRRGYYPKGGGEVILNIKPIEIQKCLNIKTRGEFEEIICIVHNRQLPDHIPKRILNSAQNVLSEYFPVKIESDLNGPSYSPGCGITLAAKFANTIIGGSMLGKKGLPAEDVGKKAAESLIEDLNGPGTVDIYSADQLVPYLGLLGGEIIVSELTEHTRTNIWLVEQFIDKKFEVEELEAGFKICI